MKSAKKKLLASYVGWIGPTYLPGLSASVAIFGLSCSVEGIPAVIAHGSPDIPGTTKESLCWLGSVEIINGCVMPSITAKEHTPSMVTARIYHIDGVNLPQKCSHQRNYYRNGRPELSALSRAYTQYSFLFLTRRVLWKCWFRDLFSKSICTISDIFKKCTAALDPLPAFSM